MSIGSADGTGRRTSLCRRPLRRKGNLRALEYRKALDKALELARSKRICEVDIVLMLEVASLARDLGDHYSYGIAVELANLANAESPIVSPGVI